jgi:uncharacterized phage protein gp47/JayE
VSLQTPTTADVATNLRNQLQAALSQSIPLLPKAALDVMAKVLAGTFILLWKYAGFIFLQLFVRYASTETITVNGKSLVPLVEWGRLFGLGDRQDANRAILDIEVTVTNQTGTLPAGAQLIHQSSGVVYNVTQAVALSAATVTARVRAASDQTGGNGLGTIGNREIGDVLSFASPLPNVARDTEVTAQVVTAENAESWDTYRSRILEFAQARPQGGAYADYRFWARTVPGIVNAYPYTGDPGEVDVYIEASVESSGSDDGIPTDGQVEQVEQAIELDQDGLATRRPVNAAVNVHKITRTVFDLEIVGVDASIQTEVREALEAYYLDREPFIVGLSVLPRRDRVLQTSLIGIIDEIVQANGLTWDAVVQSVGVDQRPAYTLDDGEKAKLGNITWTNA